MDWFALIIFYFSSAYFAAKEIKTQFVRDLESSDLPFILLPMLNTIFSIVFIGRIIGRFFKPARNCFISKFLEFLNKIVK